MYNEELILAQLILHGSKYMHKSTEKEREIYNNDIVFS